MEILNVKFVLILFNRLFIDVIDNNIYINYNDKGNIYIGGNYVQKTYSKQWSAGCN